MKKVCLLAFILFSVCFAAFGENVKIKADVKAAFPIAFGENQSDYFAISPSFDLKVEIPVFKDLGIIASGECLFGNFSDELVGDHKIGNFQFYSFLAGAFYRINLSNSFSITPAVQAGFSQFVMHSNNDYSSCYYNYFLLLASVDFEKKISEDWALYAVTSFGYYDIYCPLSLGIGAAYIF